MTDINLPITAEMTNMPSGEIVNRLMMQSGKYREQLHEWLASKSPDQMVEITETEWLSGKIFEPEREDKVHHRGLSSPIFARDAASAFATRSYAYHFSADAEGIAYFLSANPNGLKHQYCIEDVAATTPGTVDEYGNSISYFYDKKHVSAPGWTLLYKADFLYEKYESPHLPDDKLDPELVFEAIKKFPEATSIITDDLYELSNSVTAIFVHTDHLQEVLEAFSA